MKIIVARYKEEIDWIKEIKGDVLIYNKGPDNINHDYDIHHLGNIGREGHTYYKYIYDNYDNLDDYTFFLQGDPFDHSPNIINDINLFKPEECNGFKILSNWKIKCNINGCNHFNHKHKPNIRQVHDMVFGNSPEYIEWIFGAGAQFVVSRDVILRNSKDFYLNIINLLESRDTVIIGHAIERLHPLIFNNEK
jgi:hypothetical protein